MSACGAEDACSIPAYCSFSLNKQFLYPKFIGENMKIEIDTVKGFQDYLPPESLKRDKVKRIIEKWYKLYGFALIETPIVEFDNLMSSEGDDEAISDRFRLKDRGQRELGLRYEFTFQLQRILKQNPNLKLPFKRYQIGEVFRDEPVSSSRFRQFTQCDADIVGDDSVNADAECLALVSDILKELKIDAEIQVNNRKLLTSLIQSVEIGDIKSVMRELDKTEKLDLDIIKSNLRKYASVNQIVTLLKLMEKDIEFFKQNAFQGTEELEDLMEICRKYGVKVRFNPFLIRGFGYYTGNIFEIKVGKNAIGGGGRYDESIGKYLPRKIPAVGISFGLDRVTQLANVEIPAIAKLILISISQDKETINLAKKLRKSKISCIVSFDKVGKSLEYANSYKIPYAVFIGETEVSSKKFKLKNLTSGEEKLLSEKQLIGLLKK
jgi:histidyl-tRNA synthetase